MKKLFVTTVACFGTILFFGLSYFCGYGHAVHDVYLGCLRAQGPEDCKDLGFVFNDSRLAHWWSP